MQTKDISAKLTELKPGPFQQRQDFNPAKLLGLARSVRRQGVINPPLVAQNGSGYHLIAGERRWRARCANALLDSGLFPTLEAAVERVAAIDGPAYIAGQPALAGLTMTARLALGATPEQLHVAAVVENGEREDLNPIEEALDFQNLMDACQLTPD